jgi:hypothetical protein
MNESNVIDEILMKSIISYKKSFQYNADILRLQIQKIKFQSNNLKKRFHDRNDDATTQSWKSK